VDAACDDDFVRVDGGGHSLQHLSDHSTAQHVRQSRESCKRVRANDRISPEDHVAALSLNHDERETATPSTEDTSEVSQLRLAQLLLLRGKHQQALHLLDALIISDSTDADALCLRGKCFAAEGNNAGVGICLFPTLVCSPLSIKFH